MKRLWQRLLLFLGIAKQAKNEPHISYIQPGDGAGKVPEW